MSALVDCRSKMLMLKKYMARSLLVKNGLSGLMSRSFRGHNVAYHCKGLDQSSIVCEYEVNLSINEKVITEKQNFNTNC